jgi:hypothetical protein
MASLAPSSSSSMYILFDHVATIAAEAGLSI